MSVTDAHRLFLQVLMAQSALKEEEAITIAQECCTVAAGQDLIESEFQAFIRAINDGLKTVAMKIGTIKSQVTGDAYVTVVNLLGDSIAERATTHKSYTEYIRLLIETITFVQPDGTITNQDALQLRVGLKGTLKGLQEIQTLLEELTEDSWLEKTPDDNYTLGPRSLLELPGFLKDCHAAHVTAGDNVEALVDCAFCKRLCVYGHTCMSCDTRSCYPCLKIAFSPTSTTKCPNASCGKPWDIALVAPSTPEAVAAAAVTGASAGRSAERKPDVARRGGVKNVKSESSGGARSSKRTRTSK